MRRSRLFVPFLMLALAAPVAASAAGPEPTPVAEKDKKKTKSMALVKVEIRLENGKVVKSTGNLLDWNEEGFVVFDGEGQNHNVTMTPKKDGNKLRIKIAYTRDGTAIIAPFTYETAPKKREILRSDDGLALAITVTPKNVKPDEKPKRDDSIEGPEDPDDPLGGLK